MTTTEADRAERSRSDRLREEMRDYAIISAYLFVCLSAVLLYRSAVLHETGLAALPFGTAAIKALVLGKFALLGKAAGLGATARARALWQHIVTKSVMFAVLLFALSVLEEFLSGWIHGRSIAATIAEIGGGSLLLEISASVLVLVLLVGVFVAALEISRALGPGVLSRLLRSPPP